MNHVVFTFHAELNDFLAPRQRGAGVTYTFRGRVSIKDAIESLGVPHTEVEAIVVEQAPVDFAYIVRDGESALLSYILEHLIHHPGSPSGARPRAWATANSVVIMSGVIRV